jgi:hypothetical protein
MFTEERGNKILVLLSIVFFKLHRLPYLFLPEVYKIYSPPGRYKPSIWIVIPMGCTSVVLSIVY